MSLKTPVTHWMQMTIADAVAWELIAATLKGDG
jgi:hypothetical protein